jgi:hypothetical protein
MRALAHKLLRPSIRPGPALHLATHIAGIPAELTAEIDSNGSLVTKPPSEWLVCFVPGLQKEWWHRFIHPQHKHVFALKAVGDDHWLIFESWWTRIMVTVLNMDEALKFLRWGSAGSILRVTERIPGNGSQVRGWSNCSVLTSLMLGRSYWTWTPHGLYKRLSAENGVELVEVADFLEEKLTSMTRKLAEDALGDTTTLAQLPPDTALTELGLRIARMMVSPRYLSLYRFAISEASMFPGVAEAFFKHGPRQATASVGALISKFVERGQFQGRNQSRSARAFLALLRERLYQIDLGCRSNPNEADLESRTKTVVDIFLHRVGGIADADPELEELADRKMTETAA